METASSGQPADKACSRCRWRVPRCFHTWCVAVCEDVPSEATSSNSAEWTCGNSRLSSGGVCWWQLLTCVLISINKDSVRLHHLLLCEVTFVPKICLSSSEQTFSCGRTTLWMEMTHLTELQVFWMCWYLLRSLVAVHMNKPTDSNMKVWARCEPAGWGNVLLMRP